MLSPPSYKGNLQIKDSEQSYEHLLGSISSKLLKNCNYRSVPRVYFIRKNIKESPGYFRNRDYDSKKYDLEDKIRTAQERKSDFELSKRKMDIIWIHKWSLIKEKRDEMERICNNIRMVKKRKTDMVKAITACHIIKKIFQNYNLKREAVLLEMKINFAVFMFGLGLKRYLRRKAKTRTQRSMNQVRRALTFAGFTYYDLKRDTAKRELVKFLKMQSEIKDIRDHMAHYGTSVIKIQTLFRKWKESQDKMIHDVTQIWVEERDKILAHCNKKTSKQKKHLHKKVSGTLPVTQLHIIRQFIKRCIYKYQARLITWQLNYKRKNAPDNEKTILKEDIKDIILKQEKIELDLFKDISIPDMREKDKKKESKLSEDKKLPKAVLTYTNIKDIQAMFAYEADYELLDKAVLSRAPQFKFVQPNREVVQRLIVRATMDNDLF